MNELRTELTKLVDKLVSRACLVYSPQCDSTGFNAGTGRGYLDAADWIDKVLGIPVKELKFTPADDSPEGCITYRCPECMWTLEDVKFCPNIKCDCYSQEMADPVLCTAKKATGILIERIDKERE